MSELKSPKDKNYNESCSNFVNQESCWNHLIESFNDNLSKNIDELPIISLWHESLIKKNEVVVEIVTSYFLFIEEQETNSKEGKSEHPQNHERKAKSDTPNQMRGFPAIHCQVSSKERVFFY